jgi:3-dehydroquinate synthase
LLADAGAVEAGLEEFREHLGGRLTVTMLRGIGDAIDVHAIDGALLRDAIADASCT